MIFLHFFLVKKMLYLVDPLLPEEFITGIIEVVQERNGGGGGVREKRFKITKVFLILI